MYLFDRLITALNFKISKFSIITSIQPKVWAKQMISKSSSLKKSLALQLGNSITKNDLGHEFK